MKDIWDIAEALDDLSEKIMENYRAFCEFLNELKENYRTMSHYNDWGIDIRYIIDRLADLLGQKGTSTYI